VNAKDISRMLREADKAERMLAEARKVEKDLRLWALEEKRLKGPQTPMPRPELL
jgi:hypothetical protein